MVELLQLGTQAVPLLIEFERGARAHETGHTGPRQHDGATTSQWLNEFKSCNISHDL